MVPRVENWEISSHKKMTCRICFEEGNDLVRLPCACKGTIEPTVHRRCYLETKNIEYCDTCGESIPSWWRSRYVEKKPGPLLRRYGELVTFWGLDGDIHIPELMQLLEECELTIETRMKEFKKFQAPIKALKRYEKHVAKDEALELTRDALDFTKEVLEFVRQVKPELIPAIVVVFLFGLVCLVLLLMIYFKK